MLLGVLLLWVLGVAGGVVAMGTGAVGVLLGVLPVGLLGCCCWGCCGVVAGGVVVAMGAGCCWGCWGVVGALGLLGCCCWGCWGCCCYGCWVLLEVLGCCWGSRGVGVLLLGLLLLWVLGVVGGVGMLLGF